MVAVRGQPENEPVDPIPVESEESGERVRVPLPDTADELPLFSDRARLAYRLPRPAVQNPFPPVFRRSSTSG